ncbi:DNA recombination-dependent growth factor C [gamma proteobacterium IMCC2047]|nr:DNA recombination-dependent growth factor C [gamma proteobacterium IMCC2047]
MWFKNLQVYRFTKPFTLAAEELSETLAEKAFQPCAGQDILKLGWVPPLGRFGSEFVHANNGYMMICAKRQEKVLTPAVIRDELEERLLALEENEDRKVGRKERNQLKDEVMFDLLPRAFVRSSQQFAYIDTHDNLLVVNAASVKRAEEMIGLLREAVGALSLIPLTPKNLPIQTMTDWIEKGQVAADFELGQACELRDNSDTSSVIRCTNLNLESEEINNHIKASMHASKLALSWQERVECVVDDKLAVKRLRFTDVVQEKADEVEAQDFAEQFDVDFSIMTLELSAFIKALLEAFGGEADEGTA